MDKSKWQHEPCEIQDRIVKGFNWSWDTDTNIEVMQSFIREHCDPRDFIKYVADQVREEIDDFIRAENAIGCEPEPEGWGPWEDERWDDKDEDDYL